MSDAPKLHIDSDWKAQAQAEKQRIEQKAKAAEAPAGAGGAQGTKTAGGRTIPPASFETLVTTLASQAMLFLGVIPDPRSGQRIQQLDVARHQIDLLGMLDEKTKNNLTPQENELLSTSLFELRQAYIQVSQAMRQK